MGGSSGDTEWKGNQTNCQSSFKMAHMALEGVTSLGAMTVKTKGCVITWGP